MFASEVNAWTYNTTCDIIPSSLGTCASQLLQPSSTMSAFLSA